MRWIWLLDSRGWLPLRHMCMRHMASHRRCFPSLRHTSRKRLCSLRRRCLSRLRLPRTRRFSPLRQVRLRRRRRGTITKSTAPLMGWCNGAGSAFFRKLLSTPSLCSGNSRWWPNRLSMQVELDDLRAYRIREKLFCCTSRLLADPLSQLWVFFELEQYLQSLLLGIEQKPVAPVLDYLCVSSPVVAHHRQPAGHRFCYHSPRRFKVVL